MLAGCTCRKEEAPEDSAEGNVPSLRELLKDREFVERLLRLVPKAG